MISFKSSDLLKAPSPNTFILGLHVSTYTFAEDRVQSTAGPLCCQARGPASLLLWGVTCSLEKLVGSPQGGRKGSLTPRGFSQQLATLKASLLLIGRALGSPDPGRLGMDHFWRRILIFENLLAERKRKGGRGKDQTDLLGK